MSNVRSNVFPAAARWFQEKLKCFSCGKTDYKKKDCRNWNENRGRGRGFSNYRGRSSHNTRNFDRGRGYHHHYFYSTIKNNTIRESDKLETDRIDCLCVCADHVINTNEYFETGETLKEPVKVKIGEGIII